MAEKDLVKALKAIRAEAKKGKPDPDKIHKIANDALSNP